MAPTEISIKINTLKRYKFVSLISIGGLILFALLLNYSESTRRLFSIGQILREPFELPPKSNTTGERYELVYKYEQDRLPDVTFKRILFWNDVRISKYHLLQTYRREKYRFLFRFLLFILNFSISGFLIIKSDSAAMPCANGIAQYGSAKLPTIAPVSRTTTPWSFISAVGPKEICHNDGHYISATFSGPRSLQFGRNLWTQV